MYEGRLRKIYIFICTGKKAKLFSMFCHPDHMVVVFSKNPVSGNSEWLSSRMKKNILIILTSS